MTRLIGIMTILFSLSDPLNASLLYEYKLVAKTGDLDASGNTISYFLPQSASINDSEHVAFAASNDKGQSIYIGQQNPLSMEYLQPYIVSFNPPSTTRTYSNGIQLNNQKQVIARDRSGSTSQIRLWDGYLPGAFTTVVRGNTSGDSAFAYSSVFSHPTLSNSANGLDPFVAFSALDLTLNFPDTVLATPLILGITDRANFNNIQLDIPLRPMMADGGSIVVAAKDILFPGDDVDFISIYDNYLFENRTIADRSDFIKLGQSPGISDDGRVIAFSGELSASGAAKFNTTPGPGVFSWIQETCVSHGPNGLLETAPAGDDEINALGIQGGLNGICDSVKAGDDRQLIDENSSNGTMIRVAGVSQNGHLDPGEFCLDLNQNQNCEEIESIGAIGAFDLDSRVAASNSGRIAFVAYKDLSPSKGLYVSQLEFIQQNADALNRVMVSSEPRLVVQVGDTIDALGVVTDLDVHDPLNNADPRSNSGQGSLAFWLTTDQNQAIIQAIPLCPDSNYRNPSKNPYIHQYSAGRELVLPISSLGTKGGSACGQASLAMLLNGYKFANFATNRVHLWDQNDFEKPKEAVTSLIGKTMYKRPIQTGPQNNWMWDGYARKVVANEYKYVNSEIFNPMKKDKNVSEYKAWLDDKLAQGIPVVASTTFSGKARNPAQGGNIHSNGHYILFVGRTFNGDYIVKDPAGNYYAGSDSAPNHYGLDATGSSKSCGANVVYKQSDVKTRLAKRKNGKLNNSSGQDIGEDQLDQAEARWALAVPPSQAPDPAGFSAVAFFTDNQSRTYYLWVEDGNGNRSGWVPGGQIASEIPGTVLTIESLWPSDPDSSDENLPPVDTWPYMVSVDDAAPNLRVFVQGIEDTAYLVDTRRLESGISVAASDSGQVLAGQTIEISTPQPETDVTVPNVVGQTQTSAESLLTSLGLSSVISLAANDTVAAGDVISQTPLPGEIVPTGTVISLIVSSGPALVVAPNVVGLSQANAEAAILSAGLTVGAVTTANSASIPAGDVISQNPAAGTNVAPNSTVDLVVSLGPIGPVPGDLNGDSVVDSEDYAVLRSTLGKCNGDTGFVSAADLDGNGCVNYADFQNWFQIYRNQP